MAYTIIKSDGTELVTIPDGSADSTTSLTLPGPNYVGYGEKLNENLVYLLENFSSNIAPGGVNLEGQLWYDKYNQKLNVFTPNGYKSVAGITNAGIQPVNTTNGDVWFNTVTEQTFIKDAGTFKLVGPIYTKQLGVSGAIPDTVNDGITIGTTHNIIKLQVGNVLIATVSNDSDFTPSPPITGFPTINSGITFNSEIRPSINANIHGVVLGSLIGTVNGQVTGSLIGPVTGDVTGTVTGSLIGPVTGDVTGNISGTTASVASLVASTATINGGTLSGLTAVATSALTVTNLTAATGTVGNITSSNVQITGGNVTQLNSMSATAATVNTLSVLSSISASGGSMSGLTNMSSTSADITNLSTSNIRATSGTVTGLTSLISTTGSITNFSSSNVAITGGAITQVAGSATTLVVTNLSTGNARITGGNISQVTGVNNVFTSANLITSSATTMPSSASNTAIATTEFVHSVVPRGVIWMWNSTAASIPAGFQLCDGTNNTPDLRDRFIVGAGNLYAFGANGGAATTTLSLGNMPSHTHTANSAFTGTALGSHTHTITDPGHTHNYTKLSLVGGTSSGPDSNWWSASTQSTSSASTGISLAGASAGTPAGTVVTTVANTGATVPASIDNRPPFYSLCYIQKMV